MKFNELSALWAQIWQTKKRGLFFTLAAIAVGIGALSSAFSISDGADETMNSVLTGSGGKFMVVYPNTDPALQSGESKNLNLDDARAIAQVSGISRISLQKSVRGIPVKFFNQQIQAPADTYIDIYGTDPNYTIIHNRTLAKGRFIEPTDLMNERRICVITEGIRKRYFPANDYLEQGLAIDGIFFKVVGCVQPISLPAVFGETVDETAIFIPLTTCQGIFQQYDFDQIWLNYMKDYQTPEKLQLIKGRIQSILKSRHGIAEAFSLQTLDDITKQPKNLIILVIVVLGSMAVLCLLAGGIGIKHIIISRTKKNIGEGLLMKYGASNREILNRYIWESVFISSLGGCAGLMLGLITGKLAATLAGIPASLSWRFFLSGIGCTLLTGICAGFWAAKQRGWDCVV
ncbi:MAG TPA: ABC transporter permease [Bacillota bacterium]|nr:ABC transporter permease [Bacillota bacterium]